MRYLKRKCCTALKKTSDRNTRHYCSCESDQPCRLTPSLVVLLHPAAIHLVGIAGKMQEKYFFRNRQTHALVSHVLCTCVYSMHQGKVCFDWRHNRGRRSQPPPKQLYLFFKHINRYKQLLKNCFVVTKHILLCLKKFKFYFQVTLSACRPGISSRRGRGHFHFAKGTSINLYQTFIMLSPSSSCFLIPITVMNGHTVIKVYWKSLKSIGSFEEAPRPRPGHWNR